MSTRAAINRKSRRVMIPSIAKVLWEVKSSLDACEHTMVYIFVSTTTVLEVQNDYGKLMSTCKV